MYAIPHLKAVAKPFQRFVLIGAATAMLMLITLPVRAHESFATLVAELLPSVVDISTVTVNDARPDDLPEIPRGSPFEDFFEDFQDRQGQRRSQASGSGFIIDESGIIVTNNHVIENADEIRVTLHNDKTFDAVLLGGDPKTDIAVLQIDPEGEPLKVASFGDSDAMNVGDWVLAIGNPFDLGGSVTAGIVSARGRDIGAGPYDDFIQTDASINRGNSGGPLFNLQGDVVGINTAILSQSGGSVGVGLAIASNLATNVVDQLREFGRTKRGWLGVFIQEITPAIAESLELETENGALVSGVHPGGPATDAGIEIGDIVIEFDGKAIKDMRSLPRIVAETSVGKQIDVKVLRGGREKILQVTLGELEQAEENGVLAGGTFQDEKSHTFGSLGFSVAALDDTTRERFNLPDEADLTGVVITEVVGGSPAAMRGLEAGDVIRRINQKQVNSIADLVSGVNEAMAKQKASFLLFVHRDGNERFVPLPIN